MEISRRLLAGVFSACISTTAFSESDFFAPISSLEGNYVGAGIGWYPDYSGSDDMSFGAAPVLRYEFGDHRNFELIGNYATANLISHPNWRFGPAGLYRFGRDSDVDDDVVSRMEEIDDALELGAFLSYRVILNDNPRNRFIADTSVLQDVSDTHEGYSATAGVRYWDQASAGLDLGVAASVKYSSDDYMQAYYGVNAADSAASGLNLFHAESGVSAFRVMLMAAYHLSPNWHIGAGVRWERLAGDAKDSPVVRVRGDEDQIIGGIGVAYSWDEKINRGR